MRRLLIAFVCLGLCSSVHADRAATLDFYRPAPLPEDAFALSGAYVLPHLGVAAQLHLDYANDPLVYEDVAGSSDSELVSLVHDQLVAHAVVALGLLDVGVLYVQLPVELWMQGDRLGGQPTATGFGAGDLMLGGRVALHRGRHASAAFQLSVTAPTGERGADGRPGVAGDAGASVHTEVTSEFVAGPLTILADVGARWRKDTSFAGTRFTDVVGLGLGASLPLGTDALRAWLEVRGETPMDDLGARSSSPLEALLGAKLTPFAHWTFGAAGGAGLLRGYGSPDLRLVLMAGFSSADARATAPEPVQQGAVRAAPPPEQPVEVFVEEAPPAIDDRDRDGVADSEDTCPVAPGPAEQQGCPRFISYDEATGEVVLLEALGFEGSPPAVRAGSEAMLAEVAALLRANPKMKARVEAHLSRGSAAHKQLDRISVERAQAVADLLIANGIAIDRIEAAGCGNNRPVVPDRGAQRLKNERVQIYVVSPLPPAGLRSMLGCTVPEPPPAAPAPAPSAPAATPTSAPVAKPAPVATTTPAAAPKPAPAAAAPAVAPKPAPATPLVPPIKASPAPAVTPAAAPKPAPAAVTPAAAPKPAPAAVTAPTAIAAPIAASAGAAAVLAALAKQPTADADHDGTDNQHDACPLAPGTAGDGCPPNHRLDIERGTIELLKPVRFEDGAADLPARSADVIDEIAATLRANPQMKIAVESHSAQTSPDADRALTQRRAANVRKRFAEHGVAPTRVKAYGCGDSRPVAPNNVPWGRKKNDRLELHVLDPAPSAGVHSSNDCAASE